MKKTYVYEHANDVHVAAVIVYANGGKAYYDEAFTEPVTPAELKDLFLKGTLVIDTDGSLYRAFGYTSAGAVYEGGTVAGTEAEA